MQAFANIASLYVSMQGAQSRWKILAAKAERRLESMEMGAQSYRNVTDFLQPEFGELGLKIIPMFSMSMPQKIPTGAYLVHTGKHCFAAVKEARSWQIFPAPDRAAVVKTEDSELQS